MTIADDFIYDLPCHFLHVTFYSYEFFYFKVKIR